MLFKKNGPQSIGTIFLGGSDKLLLSSECCLYRTEKAKRHIGHLAFQVCWQCPDSRRKEILDCRHCLFGK